MCKIYHKQVLVCQVFSFIFWILGLKMALESGLKNSAETSYTAPNRWIRDTSAMPMTVVLPPRTCFMATGDNDKTWPYSSFLPSGAMPRGYCALRALAAQADLIVSGDADLLVLKQFQGIHIVTADQAVKRITTP